jgi:curli biogenesis system outer membrane secretion channel CsgG
MKPLHIFVAILCIGLASQAIAETQDIDKELADLTEKLAKPITERQKTKIAVIDFTDLEGNPKGELGKYIAEQLTVNFVTTKRSFSVLDRANLKRILAEHKLTAQGLVDPENAKKLGQFAGVDALVIGTIIPKPTKIVSLTAKIITTDTAEVAGAARGEFKIDETVQELMAKVVQVETATEASGSGSAQQPPAPKLFGDLIAKVQSIKLLSGVQIYGYGGPDAYGAASMTLIISNTSAATTYGVAFETDPARNLHLTNKRGDEFQATELKGIGTAFKRQDGVYGELTDIPPKSAITITSKSQVTWNGKKGDYRPYRLSVIVLFGEENQGRYPNIRQYNLVLDVE